MDQDTEKQPAAEEVYVPKQSDLFAIEVFFLGIVGLVVVAAFIEALSYKLVSSRTPFVIMVPLLILIGVHARRLMVARHKYQWVEAVQKVLQGRAPYFRKIVVLNLWFALLLALIQVAGHFAAIAFFMFMLTWYLAKERWVAALVLTAVMTLLIYLVFEQFFNIELFRGMIYRYFAGYRVF